jgi:radical SAM family RiPP maturation amino acid epimerase
VEAWRRRQLARCALAFDPLKFRAIVHPPAAIELSRGCSVGCWFCGVSAPRLTDHFRYTEATAQLWRDVLDVLGEVWGDGARWSFLYWATDPLDNPDYEHFLADFHDRFGVCPQTTTALSLRDVARTRALLRYARAHGCRYDRFSMLSLRMLERTHAAFGAEELLAVELTPLNPESGLAKANAGRYRDRWLRGEVAERPAGAIPGGATIACVSGFLLNMVDRVVTLVSPCNADDRWPLGYIVFAEAGFADGRDLRRVLGRMVAEAMRDAVGRDDSLRFRPDLRYERTADGIRLTQDTAGHRRALGFRSPGEWDLAPLGEIADLVATGALTAGEIAARLWEQAGVPPAETLAALNHLLPFGIFDEPPCPGRYPSHPFVLGSRSASTGEAPASALRSPAVGVGRPSACGGGSGLGPDEGNGDGARTR